MRTGVETGFFSATKSEWCADHGAAQHTAVCAVRTCEERRLRRQSAHGVVCCPLHCQHRRNWYTGTISCRYRWQNLI